VPGTKKLLLHKRITLAESLFVKTKQMEKTHGHVLTELAETLSNFAKAMKIGSEWQKALEGVRQTFKQFPESVKLLGWLFKKKNEYVRL
jgi:hypothetical protein